MSEYTRDDAMRDEIQQPYHTVRFITADDQWNEYPIASLRAYIGRIETERDEWKRVAEWLAEVGGVAMTLYLGASQEYPNPWSGIPDGIEWCAENAEKNVGTGITEQMLNAAIEAVRSSHE